MLTFQVSRYAPNETRNTAHLKPDNWDDSGYETKFSLTVFNEEDQKFEIGDVKIGFVGQEKGITVEEMRDTFQKLDENFFSLGQDTDYYQKITDVLSEKMQASLLGALGDVVHNSTLLQNVKSENVFEKSLLRRVSLTSIEQFRRILSGEATLTNYNFFYKKAGNEDSLPIKIEFKVEANSKPSSNIHILIGRNGVGKTTLLNNMVKALLPNQEDIEQTNSFFTISKQLFQSELIPLPNNYFAGIISVSFSAFDIFTPPNEQSDVEIGTCYDYVGLKKRIPQEGGSDLWGLKDKGDLCENFTESLSICLSLMAKRKRWKKAITTLESDSNFSDMNLCQLMDVDDELSLKQKAKSLFERMSSGHAIVLLTITKLVETVEEKTLLLIDEPESHLHPPLLSAFTRALSDLLINRNGVAIIATHSPVVLQEVPKSCVSILRRTGCMTTIDRPESETFAENVGTLTREVFGLEVSKSGFHNILKISVEEGKSYESIVSDYKDQLGFEGKLILRSLVTIRDSQSDTET